MRTLYTNAQFWSANQEIFHSLLVENSTIIATGDLATGLAFDTSIDLQNAFVIPAFIDGHAHPIFAGREAAGPQINGLTSIEEIKARVKIFAEANPQLPWIIGGAYEAAIIEGGNFDAKWLDEVVPDRPVVLHAVDHHTIWVNSKALEIAGITSETVNPVGGTIARRSDGSPQGTLREPSAMELVLNASPGNTLESDIEAIKFAAREYLKVGVTCAIDSWCEQEMAHAYIAAAKEGALGISFNLSLLATPSTWKENLSNFNEIRKQIADLERPEELKANSIKFLLDGALSAGTAHLVQPYEDNPESYGIRIWNDDELLAALIEFDLLGYQLHLHAIGDAAVKQALDALEIMQSKNPLWDRRSVIVHAQLIRDEDLPRFQRLGVIANIQPLWCYLDPMNKELIEPRIGKIRNNRQYPLRSLINSGATIAFGSDWPVTSHVPLEAIMVPVLRANLNSENSEAWNINESITFEESLTFYTKNAAFQMFRENERGSLEAGKVADFIVLKDLTIVDVIVSGVSQSSSASE